MTAMQPAQPSYGQRRLCARRLSASRGIRKGALPGWRDWLATLKPGQAREGLFDIKVHQQGRLTTVWVPFRIAVDGELSGCGVNAFTMVDIGEPNAPEWRIVTGMDVQSEGCEGFRESYKASNSISRKYIQASSYKANLRTKGQILQPLSALPLQGSPENQFSIVQHIRLKSRQAYLFA